MHKKIMLFVEDKLPVSVGRYFLRSKVAKIINKKSKVKVVLGASDTRFSGWISTNKDILDITKESDWRRVFGKNKIDNILAEHVFEHLSEEQVRRAFVNIYRFLNKNGVFRFAVPDGYHILVDI